MFLRCIGRSSAQQRSFDIDFWIVDNRRPSTFFKTVTPMSTPTLRSIDRRLSNDVDRLQAVLEGAPEYSLVVEGRLPPSNAAIELLDALPPGKDHSDKYVYEVVHEAEVVGCLEMVRGYPDTDIAFIGLLLFREGYQGRGFGPRVLRLAEAIGTG